MQGQRLAFGVQIADPKEGIIHRVTPGVLCPALPSSMGEIHNPVRPAQGCSCMMTVHAPVLQSELLPELCISAGKLCSEPEYCLSRL